MARSPGVVTTTAPRTVAGGQHGSGTAAMGHDSEGARSCRTLLGSGVKEEEGGDNGVKEKGRETTSCEGSKGDGRVVRVMCQRFAECRRSGTRQRIFLFIKKYLSGVLYNMYSAKKCMCRLGLQMTICRVPYIRHTSKKTFVECLSWTLDKLLFCQVNTLDTRQSLLAFFLFLPTFLWCVPTFFRSICSIFAQLSKCLLYLLHLVHLIDFLVCVPLRVG